MWASRRGLAPALLAFVSLLPILQAQTSEKLSSQNPCLTKQTCHECIQTPTCAWCSQEKFGDTKRCFQPNVNTNVNLQCDEAFVVNPDNVFSLLEARELKKASHSASGSSYVEVEESSSGSSSFRSHEAVQISPQNVSLKLRINEAYRMDFSYAQAEDYPVDLYYLMDLSNSMKDDKDKLSSLGNTLADTMRGMTSDFKLGFGSFVDKVVMPYVSTVPKKLKEPCDKCEAPYGFKNLMPLNSNTAHFSVSAPHGSSTSLSATVRLICNPSCILGTNLYNVAVYENYERYFKIKENLHVSLAVSNACLLFAGSGYALPCCVGENVEIKGQVQRANVSGNLDAPEGGFDAIMQAIVCKREIGWREKARKLLVFSTDAGFHYAGDGKLGGIVKPNDGECHLDSRGTYTYSSIQDYPSISQVNLKVKQNSINVIFAVTADQIGVYEQLGDNIEGASSGKLSEDSSNVVDLVKEQYSKITSSVEMKDTASSHVKVTYYSNCLKGGPPQQTNKCTGLKVGNVVNFSAEIEVTACPADRNEWNQIFKIYPVGVAEYLTVNLEMLCECPCEKPGNVGFEERSRKCSGFGTYKCGVCDCDDSHFGRTCECDADNTHGSKDLTAGCRADNTSITDCSGRGTCICGICECDGRPDPSEEISGQYCECDNFSCDRNDGKLCSGPQQGTCVCGKCQCLPGWMGNACDCKSSTENCIPKGGGEVCSGKGVCECGVCKCNEGDEGRYSGKYCDKCPTCPGRCLEFKECVQCQVYKTGPLTPEECAANCTFIPTTLKVIEADEEKDENLCSYFDEEDCRFSYIYGYDEEGKIYVVAQEERECPPEVYILGIVLGVIGAIVLIGLAMLLLWKVLTTIHDRREFAKFEKERMKARWDTGENPIYKQATSTFKNPTYSGK